MKRLHEFSREVSVVVSSCDAFFDAWRPFAFFFRKFWPECPFRVWLVTNELEVRSKSIRALRVGSDRGWATNLQLALQRVETPHLLYFQEDYFLTSAVDGEQLGRDIAHALEVNAVSLCFRDLSRLEAPRAQTTDRLVIVPRESEGRTRLQATLWQRDALAAIINAGETAWEMEARGSGRTRDLRMLSYARNEEAPLQYLMSAIVRGLWTPEALALCRAHGFEMEPHFRREFVDGKWPRRWRRALTRISLAQALAKQRGRPVELD